MSRALTASTDLLQLLGVQGAGLGEHQDLFAEGHQRGDGRDAGLGGELLLGLGVHLGEDDVGCFSETAEYVGPNCLHGPHHSAQKSTRTMSLPSMVDANCSPVMSTVAMGPTVREQLWIVPGISLLAHPGRPDPRSGPGVRRGPPGAGQRRWFRRHSWIHSGSSRSGRRRAEFAEDFLLADGLALADQPGGDVGAGIDFAVHHHPLLEVDGLRIEADDLGFDGVLLPELQRTAEGDGLPRPPPGSSPAGASSSRSRCGP